MDAIFHRTSIRKYQETPVEAEKIETLLRAAMAAPSACNQQPWEFYVVRNKEKIKELSEASPYAGCAKGAPVVFVPCYRKNCQVPMYAEIDLSAAVENLLLEADSLGLGAVWMGIACGSGHDDAAHFIPAAFKGGAFRAQVIRQGNVIAYLHDCYPRVLRSVDRPPDRFGLFTVSDSFNLRLLLVCTSSDASETDFSVAAGFRGSSTAGGAGA